MRSWIVGSIFSLIGLFGLEAQAQVKVVATMPDLGAIAKAVGGDLVEVSVLASHKQDPHYVDARPSFIVKLSRADLVLLNGLELEVGWLPPLIANARNPQINLGSQGYFDASFFVKRLQVPQGPIDRAQGDIHPGGNPHFTSDPRQTVNIARALAQRLGHLDTKNQAKYAERADKFAKELQAFAKEQKTRFAKLSPQQRKTIVFHDSMRYLWDWLGIVQAGTVEPKPGIPPTPSHAAKVLKVMRSQKVKVIVQEGFYTRRQSETLARLAKAQLVVIPGGTDFKNGQTYQQYVKQITEALYGAFSKK